ncbi:hypothetical protein TOPH_06351 [Tolypocladium ophioglossoides CBS 100239]|uniref:Uncharacterized protein n=1 Tax=Tolypocladium ophioglossoides (strain CBS 100239) TaxID=1163406 RepID=A0A0L0N4W0_TOLOC|nr:hypothetical protein TOPH_06351 [Tolypocladium ophioglossoides CBS 100239]
MARINPSRAARIANSSHPSRARSVQHQLQLQHQHPPIKRQRDSSSPIYVSSVSRVSAEDARDARKRLFDALEKGDRYPGMRRCISCADGLSEVQLGRCFEILHACGRATDLNATLEKTRQSVDGFLEAIFNQWTSDHTGDLLQPELEFLVEAEVVAGRICLTPDKHSDVSSCCNSGVCNVDVSAAASYSCNPAMLKLEFSMVDPFTGRPETFCPIGRGDIRWAATDWERNLKQTLLSKMVSQLHKFNKHLAIWQARKLVAAWGRGSVSMGAEAGDMGFLGRDMANVAILGFGAVDAE